MMQQMPVTGRSKAESFIGKCFQIDVLQKLDYSSISIYLRSSKCQLSEEATSVGSLQTPRVSNLDRILTGFGNHAYSIILDCFLLSGVARIMRVLPGKFHYFQN